MAASFSAAIPILRAVLIVVLFSLAGCEKKGGEAVVISKKYIPAASAEEPVGKEHQLSPEQWRVLVEMRADLRKVEVLVEQAEWGKLKVGDRVNVRYSQGKYTGTIWGSEIK